MSETKLVKQAVDYLNARGVFAWRNNTGAFKGINAQGKSRFHRFGYPGSGDVFAILPPEGQFCSIECKVKDNKPTLEQVAFIQQVRESGGISFVARSIDDIEKVLNVYLIGDVR